MRELEPRNTRKTRKSHFLEKLLDGAEVEWLPLGEVFKPQMNADKRRLKRDKNIRVHLCLSVVKGKEIEA